MVTRRASTPILIAVWLFAVSTGGCGEGEKPAAPPSAPTVRPGAPAKTAPLVAPSKAADWCGEHGVPESACTKCNADLIPDFKKKGDWCEKHGLPDSQCTACHPELVARFKAMAPAGK
jgi:hypothetical protein